MNDQKHSSQSNSLNALHASNFTEIERLRSLNKTLKGADSKAETNLLKTLKKLKE